MKIIISLIIALILFSACITNNENIFNPENIDFLKSAKKISIVVDQSNITLPYLQISKKIINMTDLKIVKGSEQPDIILEIQANGKAVSKSYGCGRQHFTGAKIWGVIKIKDKNQMLLLQKNFNGNVLCSTSVRSDRYTTIYDAPFNEALTQPDSFIQLLLYVARNYFGTNIQITSFASHGFKFEFDFMKADMVSELRYDGLYLNQGENNLKILRFYEDGVVVSVTCLHRPSSDLSSSLKHIAEWFNKDAKHCSIGKFTIDNSNIKFTLKKRSGNVVIDYKGTIFSDEFLMLNCYSHCVNYKFFKIYKFTKVNLRK